MKFAKYAALALMLPGLAFGQTLPSPLVLNLNASGYVAVGGSQQGSNVLTVRGPMFQGSSITDPTADYYFFTQSATANYTANASGGDTIGIAGQLAVLANGKTVTAPQHIAGVYGVGYLGPDGNAASLLTWVNGVLATSGNQGPGTVTNAIDFHGHPDLNTAGGTLTNHYFLYQEPSTAATNEYGAYFSAPVGIGGQSPTYNLDMSTGLSGKLSGTYYARFGTGVGTLQIQSNGTCMYPAGCAGAGSISAPFFEIGPNVITASSGELAFSKIAATGTAPGGGGAKMEVVCGTTAGTAKIIVYAGTSTTPSTLLDNIGTGVTGC